MTTTKLPKVGVACILSGTNTNKVLVGKRKGSHGAGKWAPPGGHIELNESWNTTCQRELQEETGLDIDGTRFTFFTATNDCAIDGNIDKHYITIFMQSSLNDNEIAQIQNMEPNKCEGWVWMTWDEILTIRQTAPETLFEPFLHFLDAKYNKDNSG